MFTISQNKKYLFKIIKKHIFRYSIYAVILMAVVFDILMFTTLSESFSIVEQFQTLFASLVAISFILVFYQMDVQTDGSRRQFTATEISRYVNENSAARDQLNKLLKKHIDYSSRILEEDRPFSIDEIHILLCEHEEVNGEIIFKRANPNRDKPYKLTKEGRNIRHYIVQVLNNFEQIASNIFHGTLDEDMCKNIFYKSILQNYRLYNQYINHLRGGDHYNDEHALENFQWLAERWGKNLSILS